MQISVLFAYCSGRNFNDSDLPLISKYGTRLILGRVIGPRGHEYLMSLRIINLKPEELYTKQATHLPATVSWSYLLVLCF